MRHQGLKIVGDVEEKSRGAVTVRNSTHQLARRQIMFSPLLAKKRLAARRKAIDFEVQFGEFLGVAGVGNIP